MIVNLIDHSRSIIDHMTGWIHWNQSLLDQFENMINSRLFDVDQRVDQTIHPSRIDHDRIALPQPSAEGLPGILEVR